MTQLVIDVVDISGGTHPDDKVRLWAPQHRPDGERVVSTSPVDVKLVEGKATVEVLPGPARVQIMTRGVVDSAPKRVTIPDEQSVTLRAVIEDGLEWEPEVISRVATLASRAESAATRAEAGADRVGSAEQVGAWVEEAGAIRGNTVAAADRAETQAGVATEQASLARQHREGAEGAESSAHGAAGAAAASTTALIRDEMDAKVAEAGQSAQSAGESAAASATSAGESAASAQEAGQSAQAAGAHLQDTRDLKSGIDAWWLDDLLPTVDAVAADRAATQDDRRQTGEDRAATGGHLTEVTRLHGEAEQARDDAQEAAANAQTGAPPEGWQRDDMHEDVREDLSRARSALQDLPDATGEARGAIRLSGDLGGTATSPTVPGLASKSDVGHDHEIDDTEGLGAALSSAGETAEWGQVSGRPTQFPPEGHRHPADHIDNLDALIDQRAMDLLREVPMLMMWDGQGEWVAPEWASTKQGVLNMATQEIHSVEDING